MGLETIFTGVFIGVFQIVLLIIVGLVLARLGPLDATGERKFTLANYYVFLPLFCGIELAKAVDAREGLDSIAFLIFSFTASSMIAAFLATLYCNFFRVDFRAAKSFVTICTFGSVTAFPAIMARALCDDQGPLRKNEYCVYAQGYSVIGLLMLNVYLWTIAPLVISRDKAACYTIRRKAYLIREFYISMQEFLDDKELDRITEVQQERHSDLLEPIGGDDEVSLNDKFFQYLSEEKMSEDLEAKELIEFSLHVNLCNENYKRLSAHFALFLQKIHPKVFDHLCSKIPGTAMPLQISCQYLLWQLVSPPIVASFVGLILGLITPVKQALFHELTSQISIKTLSSLSNMAIPLLVLLLGAKLYAGASFSNDVNLRRWDLVALIIIRLVLVPAVGLGFMWLVSTFGSNTLQVNKVLRLIMFAFWNVPPSVLTISAFVMVGYYSKEVAILQFWSNLLSAFSMSGFYVVYFLIFP